MRALLKISVLVLLLAGFLSSISSTIAQPFVIFGYTNQNWKYNTANIDGTGWEAAAYDDTIAGWSVDSRGALGSEDTAATITSLNAAGATINTPIALEANNARLTTWYFRTHFNLASTNGVSLIFSNRVDDGVVVYLNGQEIYRTGSVPGTPPVYAAAAANIESTTLTVVTTNTPFQMQPGDNVLAVRLHQTSATSSDKVLAIALSGAIAIAPAINYAASSLANRTIIQCVGSTTLSVSASGFPVPTYQWTHAGTNLPNATNATFTINNPQAANAGNYNVIVSNSVGSVTSTPDTVVTVTPDATPPQLVFGYVQTNLTNILLFFNETISTNCGACLEMYANVTLVDTNTGNQVTTLAGQTYFSGSRSVALYTDGTPLDISHGYDITLSLVEDACVGNVLPDTTYPIGHLVEHVIGFSSEWKYDINNGDRFGTGWETVGYNDSAWPSGPGGLGHESNDAIGFPGNNAIPILTHLNYTSNSVPVFFRRHFTLPGTGTNSGGLVLNALMEDGAVYFINGQETFRQNVGPEVLSAASRTLAGAQEPTIDIQGPFFVPATGLVPGDNVIAVAVLQTGATSSDLEMALDLSIVLQHPVPSGPTLHISANGSISTITWTGGGTLQRSLNISSPANWVTIPGASSPFVTNAPPAIQFFRVTVP